MLSPDAAQGMEARKGRGEDSVEDDSPVGREAEAPSPHQEP